MIWVRSQDKEMLVESSNFRICYELSKGKISHYIIESDSGNSTFELGKYSTKEKALKVLDKIEMAIFNRFYDSESVVFQMPQDDEVEV